MDLEPMRFKDYTWPHNPERYMVEYRRSVAALKVPFGGYCLQDLGTVRRVFRGEGVFSGPGAYEEFEALARTFEQAGPGTLVHPVWQSASAYFVELELVEEPLPDYVRYTFAFWEDRGGHPGRLEQLASESGGVSAAAPAKPAAEAVHTVRKGDTLWGIARQYGVELTALIAANPQIKNPNLIYPGERVKLP